MNPYNPCVFNGMNNGKQLTVTLHVDDLKLSHMDLFNIMLFACYLSRIYENNIVVRWGKIHAYLGMNFDLSEKGKVNIDMIPLLEFFWIIYWGDWSDRKISIWGSFVQNKEWIRGNISLWRTGCWLPSHYGTSIIYHAETEKIYTDNGLIFNNKSNETRWGRLDEIKEVFEVPEG